MSQFTDHPGVGEIFPLRGITEDHKSSNYMQENKEKFFYGWIIAVALFLIAFLPMTFVNTFFAYYQAPIVSAFAITDASFNIANTTSSLGAMLFSLLLATKITKGNIRLWMLIGGVLGALCYFCLSYTQAIWQVWVLIFVAVFSISAITYVSINFLIAQWFVDKKGLVTSLIFAGTGLGGILFSTFESNFIKEWGWRNGFRLTAIITAVVTIIAALLIRKSPSDVGLSPYTSKKKSEVKSVTVKTATASINTEGLTKAEALKTTSFWLYAISMLFIGAVSAGIITQLAANLSYKGYVAEFAVVYMVVSAAMVIGKLVLGPIVDKFGIIAGIIFACICGVVGLIFLIFVPVVPAGESYNVWVLLIPAFVAAALIPIGTSLAAVGPPLITSHLFGYKDFGGIYGIGNMVFMVGCMVGPLISSGIYTASESYTVAWIVFGVIFVLIPILSLLAVSKKAKPGMTSDATLPTQSLQ